MKESQTTRIGCVLAILLLASTIALAQTPLGSEFTYQAQLKLNGVPLNDSADLEFSLYDADSNGLLVAGPITVSNLAVVDGLFQASLDFGVSVLDGSALWLEIAVRSPHDPGDTEPFTPLDPRQPLTAAPYALQTRGLFVDNAGNVGIGTTSPQFPLHVRDDDAIVQIDTALADGTPWTYYTQQNTLRAAVGYRDENAALTFFVNGSDHMVIEDSGQVGIGTTTPSTALEVSGTVTATAFVGDGSGLTNLPVTGGVWTETGSDIFYDAGNVGIGTTSPSAALDVNGNVVIGGGSLDQVQEQDFGFTQSGSWWQSFTAGTSGWLIAVEVLVSDLNPSGSGTLEIRLGQGSSGTLLATQAFSNFPVGSTEWVAIPIAAWPTVNVGQQYTFRFLSSHSFRAATGDLYSGGMLSGYPNADMAFRTFVRPTGIAGKVGIGTRFPSAGLEIHMGATNDTALQLTSSGAGWGSGIRFENTSGTKYGIYSGADNNWHFANVDADADIMTLNSANNVGIGTTNPTRGKVDIEGSQSFNIASYGFLDSNGFTGIAGGTNAYSLYASDRIAASEFNAHSDARIKKVLGRSDSAADLNTLTEIEITDYTLIDTVAKGKERHKKVIGQQVNEVFPQAVTISTDVVPDIYKLADVKEGWIMLATDLAVGDRVRLITEGNSELYEVLEVRADSFRVDLPPAETVFVFGREVDDFHSVDYEEIAMLNVSATQELHKQMRLKDTEIAALQEKNAELEVRLARIEAMLSEQSP